MPNDEKTPETRITETRSTREDLIRISCVPSSFAIRISDLSKPLHAVTLLPGCLLGLHRGVAALRSRRLHLLLQIVQFLAQFAILLLQVEHFAAQVLKIVHWLARGAQVRQCLFRRSSFGVFFRGGSKSFQRGD